MPFETKILFCEPTTASGVWHMKLEGHMDMGPTLDAVEKRVSDAIRDGCTWMIFDVAQIRSFADLGTNSLVFMACELRAVSGGAVLVGLTHRGRVVMECFDSGLSLFKVCESFDDALKAIASARNK